MKINIKTECMHDKSIIQLIINAYKENPLSPTIFISSLNEEVKVNIDPDTINFRKDIIEEVVNGWVERKTTGLDEVNFKTKKENMTNKLTSVQFDKLWFDLTAEEYKTDSGAYYKIGAVWDDTLKIEIDPDFYWGKDDIGQLIDALEDIYYNWDEETEVPCEECREEIVNDILEVKCSEETVNKFESTGIYFENGKFVFVAPQIEIPEIDKNKEEINTNSKEKPIYVVELPEIVPSISETIIKEKFETELKRAGIDAAVLIVNPGTKVFKI